MPLAAPALANEPGPLRVRCSAVAVEKKPRPWLGLIPAVPVVVVLFAMRPAKDALPASVLFAVSMFLPSRRTLPRRFTSQPVRATVYLVLVGASLAAVLGVMYSQPADVERVLLPTFLVSTVPFFAAQFWLDRRDAKRSTGAP